MKIILNIVVIFLMQVLYAGTPWTQIHGDEYHNGRWDGAFNVDNIQHKWTFKPTENNQLSVTSLNSATQVCVSEDDAVVFACGKSAETTNAIIAVNAMTGALLWQHTVYSENNLGSTSSPVYHGGYIYWIGSNSETIFVYKINASTGTTDSADGGWLVSIDDDIIVNASPLVTGTTLYFSSYADFMSYNANHYALNTTDGSVKWSNKTAGGAGVSSMLYVESKNLLYQPTFVNSKHNISSFDPESGNIVETSEDLDSSSFALAISYYNNHLYFQDYDFLRPGAYLLF